MLIDLRFLGLERAIGVYVVETTDGLALFDCGPSTTLEHLHEGLADHGLELADIRHLLVSHIHFDHAGAAGALVRAQPEMTVWVSAIGAPHLADPSRLESSARRLYGDTFDSLWGGLAPVPESNLRIAEGDVLGWEAFPSPGHASHHVCYLRDGLLLAGDACGVRPQPAVYVLPVSPPPDVDVEAWHATIAEIERRRPERLALIHFGIAADAAEHLARLRDELDCWAAVVRNGASEEEFGAFARDRIGADAGLYDQVAPLSQSWQGLRRYWDKRDAAEAAARATS
jgi:glyoxylase-like metal-dependent hydrolase (beta-lactamase superfamily II)